MTTGFHLSFCVRPSFESCFAEDHNHQHRAQHAEDHSGENVGWKMHVVIEPREQHKHRERQRDKARSALYHQHHGRERRSRAAMPRRKAVARRLAARQILLPKHIQRIIHRKRARALHQKKKKKVAQYPAERHRRQRDNARGARFLKKQQHYRRDYPADAGVSRQAEAL